MTQISETTQIRNPFPVYRAPMDSSGNYYNGVEELVGWKWYDEAWQESEKLYPSQEAALRDLLAYIDWLNNGPSFWQRVKLFLRKLWKDEGH